MSDLLRRMTIFLLAVLPLAAQPLDDEPLATVGDITITRREFLSRYELTPSLRQSRDASDRSKADFLLSLIGEKLLAQRAKQTGLGDDPAVESAVRAVERMLVRDELYRREISQRVMLSDAETDAAMRLARNELKVYFLYARTKVGAGVLMERIRNGRALESFRFGDDARGEFAGPDSAMARWGDTDERMEKAVFALKPGETSEPVELDDGWYIAKLMGKTVTVTAGEKERAALRERVEAVLRKRKETARMADFMAAELKDKKAEVNARLLKRIVLLLAEDAARRRPVRGDTAAYFVDEASEASLRESLRDTMETAFVTFPHRRWSVAEAVSKVRETNLAVPNPTVRTVRNDVEQRLREVIDQEFLTELAYARGYHQTDAVRNETALWRDAYRAQRMRGVLADSVTVSDGEMEQVRRIFRADTSIVNSPEKAKKKAAEIELNDLLDRTAGGLAGSVPVRIFQRNLESLTLTSAPSLVFRYIGFGGRMFAVPLVVPHTGWVRYWNTADTVLP